MYISQSLFKPCQGVCEGHCRVDLNLILYFYFYLEQLVDKVFVRDLPSWCHLKGMEAQRAQKDSKMVYIQQNLFSDII